MLLRVWQPSEVIAADDGRGEAPDAPAADTSSIRRERGHAGVRRRNDPGHRSDVAKAYAPYTVIIAIFSIANITAVKEFLAEPAIHV